MRYIDAGAGAAEVGCNGTLGNGSYITYGIVDGLGFLVLYAVLLTLIVWYYS